MTHEDESTEASRQYTTAYDAHYTGRDLPRALWLYQGLVASHPSAVEAGYARMQMQNIVNAVVSRPDLIDAQMQLLPAQFHRVHSTVTDVAPTLRV